MYIRLFRPTRSLKICAEFNCSYTASMYFSRTTLPKFFDQNVHNIYIYTRALAGFIALAYEHAEFDKLIVVRDV